MEAVLILIMSSIAVILVVSSMSNMSKNTVPGHKTYKFISTSSETYLIRAGLLSDAKKEAKKIEKMHSVEWDLIDELDDNGDKIRTLYKKPKTKKTLSLSNKQGNVS